jgi:hypothetical protein
MKTGPRFRGLFGRVIALVALPLAAAVAQATVPPPAILTTPPSAADSALRITLLTMGQGDPVYEMFGHNGLWVHDPATGTDNVYDWGVFDFRSEGFLVRFLQGDMRYTMAENDVRYTLAAYQSRNRRVWAQELNLTPSEKRALVDYIRWNWQPENRQYRYDYYLDNCSTRVRDALDRVLGGRLRAHLQAIPTDQTYRSHSLRLMQTAPFLVTGVQIALGRRTDVRLSGDQASFLPVQLMTYLRDFKLDGGSRPIVAREYVFNEAMRAPEPTNVPGLWKGLLPMGVLVAGILLGLWLARARIAAATLTAIVAGLIGIVGTILVLLATVTDHVASHWNENLLLFNPIWLVAAIVVTRTIASGKWSNASSWATRIGIALAVIAPLLHLVGVSKQPNWDVIALALPVQLVIAAIAWNYRSGFGPVTDAGKVKNST